MKKYYFLLLLICIFHATYGQVNLTGIILDRTDSTRLVGVSVSSQLSKNLAISDSSGSFEILTWSVDDSISFDVVGYEALRVSPRAFDQGYAIIYLSKQATSIDEVIISTGYQSLAASQSVGSYVQIDNKLLNRSYSTDIISRLEGVASGLAFNRRASGRVYGDQLELRVRGQGTIDGNNAPLIVVDNFPYEGNIGHINPNDVESVTILRDAAAASIWGARAGNGVVVITTKNGGFGQPLKVEISSNITKVSKPDLSHSPNFIHSPDYISLERRLFDQGFYNAAIASFSPVTPVVELLEQNRKGVIDNNQLEQQLSSLEQYDVRQEVSREFYRDRINQQNAVSIRGGTPTATFFLSSSFDKNMNEIVGNDYTRTTLSLNNVVKPLSGLKIANNFVYAATNSQNNGLGVDQLHPSGRILHPYARFKDEEGNHLSQVRKLSQAFVEQAAGEMELLDWAYRPLDEKNQNNARDRQDEVRINSSVDYVLNNYLSIGVKYQFQKSKNEFRDLAGEKSYYVRDLVNSFTQDDGTRPIPLGGILTVDNGTMVAHNGRAQMDFNRIFGNRHKLMSIAGYEVRQAHRLGSGQIIYGYNEDVLTAVSALNYDERYRLRPTARFAQIPQPLRPMTDHIDRYISYYANTAYTLDNKYTFFGSIRKDASNLFGVKVNQRGVPLWAIGTSWVINEEGFMKDNTWIDYLKLRVSYGYNGNVDKNATAYTTAYYLTNPYRNRSAAIQTPPNPRLRWEKVRIVNAGLDFRIFESKVTGRLEYFTKLGMDLLAPVPLDPTTGFLRNHRLNYADIKTTGFDAELNMRIIDKKLQWSLDMFVNYAKDKVTNYQHNDAVSTNSFINLFPPARKGRARYGVYSYPWYGLDGTTGDPLVRVDGELNKEYTTFITTLTPEDLIYHGSAMPVLFGSLRNSFSWNNLALSVNILWKGGYYFRRESVSYNRLFANGDMHEDYYQRWKVSNDERKTNVPSLPSMNSVDLSRDGVYLNSEVLIEKGDHIRLQDVNLSYLFEDSRMSTIKNIALTLYMGNVGILWRSNKHNLDPDYPSANYPAQFKVALGLKADF